MRGLTLAALALVITGLHASPLELLEPRQGGINSCCFTLRYRLGDSVSFRTTRPSPARSSPNVTSYEDVLGSFWSAQESEILPNCIVTPRNTDEVAIALTTIRLSSSGGREKCPFAIKSGGHTPWAGAANIEGGVTINLGLLKEVTLNTDKTIASIGPGARWVDVYDSLIPFNLSVTGGRVSDVGVGGLVTGGGMSFFAPRYGFACDTVENFQVVIASGEVVNANANENADLWYALKGGSNNFGIVTRFDMRTFPQGDLWGGFALYPIETRTQHFRAFEALNSASEYDESAALICNFAYVQGIWIVANNYIYTKPEAYPAAFKPFTDIQPEIPGGNTLRITNISDITRELRGKTGDNFRNLFATGTYRNDATLLSKIFDYTNDTLQRLLVDTPVANLTYSITFQAVPTSITSRAAENGGNALGLDPADGPLVLTLLTASWSDAADDARVQYQAQKLFELAGYEARRRGLDNDWIYLNYAASWQNPIKGYGPEVGRVLRETSRRVDPDGVFQKEVPGGFKLNFANGAGSGLGPRP